MMSRKAAPLALAFPIALTFCSWPVAAVEIPALNSTGVDGVVKASQGMKRNILMYMPWGGGLDAKDYKFWLARSNQRYGVGYLKNANSKNLFVKRLKSGRWIYLRSLSGGTAPEDLCKAPMLRKAGMPTSVQRDFIAGKFCYV